MRTANSQRRPLCACVSRQPDVTRPQSFGGMHCIQANATIIQLLDIIKYFENTFQCNLQVCDILHNC